jgi:hypothetical protein
MRLAYLDEAGISNPAHEPYLVVAGVLIEADRDWRKIAAHLRKVAIKHLPREDVEGFVFHATDIFHGSGYFDRAKWPNEKRRKILADLSAIPSLFDLPIVAGYMPRQIARNFYLNKQPTLRASTIANLIHAEALIRAAVSIDKWLRKVAPDEVAMLVVEGSGKIEAALKMIHDGYSDPHADQGTVPVGVFQTTRIIETIHFSKKRVSNASAWRHLRFHNQAPTYEKSGCYGILPSIGAKNCARH